MIQTIQHHIFQVWQIKSLYLNDIYVCTVFLISFNSFIHVDIIFLSFTGAYAWKAAFSVSWPVPWLYRCCQNHSQTWAKITKISGWSSDALIHRLLVLPCRWHDALDDKGYLHKVAVKIIRVTRSDSLRQCFSVHVVNVLTSLKFDKQRTTEARWAHLDQFFLGCGFYLKWDSAWLSTQSSAKSDDVRANEFYTHTHRFFQVKLFPDPCMRALWRASKMGARWHEHGSPQKPTLEIKCKRNVEWNPWHTKSRSS